MNSEQFNDIETEDFQETLKVELKLIKDQDEQLRFFKYLFEDTTSLKVEDFCFSLMLVNSYKLFIDLVNDISFRAIRFTLNGEKFNPNKSVLVNDAQYKKYKEYTISTFDVILIVAENELDFKSCDYEEITGTVLDNAIKYIKDNELVDLVLEQCELINSLGLEHWFEDIKDRLVNS